MSKENQAHLPDILMLFLCIQALYSYEAVWTHFKSNFIINSIVLILLIFYSGHILNKKWNLIFNDMIAFVVCPVIPITPIIYQMYLSNYSHQLVLERVISDNKIRDLEVAVLKDKITRFQDEMEVSEEVMEYGVPIRRTFCACSFRSCGSNNGGIARFSSSFEDVTGSIAESPSFSGTSPGDSHKPPNFMDDLIMEINSSCKSNNDDLVVDSISVSNNETISTSIGDSDNKDSSCGNSILSAITSEELAGTTFSLSHDNDCKSPASGGTCFESPADAVISRCDVINDAETTASVTGYDAATYGYGAIIDEITSDNFMTSDPDVNGLPNDVSIDVLDTVITDAIDIGISPEAVDIAVSSEVTKFTDDLPRDVSINVSDIVTMDLISDVVSSRKLEEVANINMNDNSINDIAATSNVIANDATTGIFANTITNSINMDDVIVDPMTIDNSSIVSNQLQKQKRKIIPLRRCKSNKGKSAANTKAKNVVGSDYRVCEQQQQDQQEQDALLLINLLLSSS